MQLFTNLGDSTVNVFETILIETKMQRNHEGIHISQSINEIIAKHFRENKIPPKFLVLGKKETKYFPINYRYAGRYGDITVIKVKPCDNESTIEISV